MREIKFRAWCDMDDGVMLQPGDNYGTKTDLDCVQYLNQGQNIILMQFTGLTDKNGVDIYEGDIVENKLGRVCKIFWFQASGCWDSAYLYDKDVFDDAFRGYHVNQWEHCIEVIGNIYQNEELLTLT